MSKKHIQSDEKIGLKLTQAERSLLLTGLTLLPSAYEDAVKGTVRRPKRYPLCVDGERACPPEDVGGIGGFYEFLEALADPKHNQHDEFMEWGGEFDAGKFDAQQATREMKEVKQ